jgi:F0F1-type ATP synthase membrane subunit b/b'
LNVIQGFSRGRIPLEYPCKTSYVNIMERSVDMNEKMTENFDSNDQDKNENEKLYPHQLTLETLFIWFIGILNGKAWEYLGLMMNPETKDIKQDLKKAKISIDSIEFLLNQIKTELKDEDKKEMENILANLQMNYVEKYQESKKSN